MKWWRGPKQTPDEEKSASRFMTDHMLKYPDSKKTLGKYYPQESRAAEAHRQYRILTWQYENGGITEKEYNERVEKILPLLDISDIC